IRPGHFTFDLGLEGHLGKMPPAFFTSVLDRTELSALGTMGHGSKGVGNLDGNLSPVQIHGNRANLPRGGQLQKPSVMLHDHGIRFAQWIGQITLQKCPEKLALPHRCRKNPKKDQYWSEIEETRKLINCYELSNYLGLLVKCKPCLYPGFPMLLVTSKAQLRPWFSSLESSARLQ